MRPDGKGLAVASHYLLTDDYGDTWPTTGNTNPFNYLTACWLKENGDIFAGTNGTANNGLLRKTATGWTQWTNIGNVIKIRFSDEMVGYTGSQTGRLYKTTDGGNTWTEAGQIPGAIKHLNVLNENIVYANRHRTLDGGQTWNEIPNLDIIILFHFFTIDHGMGLDGSGNVYETINGGETWQNIFNSSITGPGTLSLFKTVIFLKDKIIGLYPNSDIYVLNFPELTASITKTDVSCYGNNDGTVLAEATGGIPPYTYLWTSADNETIEPSNLSSGTYTLTVTDANGNSINQDITINQPLEAIITQHPADVITFNGGNAAYTVNTINIDSYQWQASIDGTTWTDIANGGSAPSYAGTTTNTLTIIQVPNDYTGYSYRVVMKNGVDCTFISNTATLTLGNILEAVNDDFSSVEILAGVGGIAGDVTTNDLLNGIQLDDNDISTTITNNSGLTNTFINSNGDLVIPSTAEQGIYTITYNICPVTFSANCSSAQVKVTISEVMGTKDIEELNLNVYPNPVEDKLFVISDSTILKITIYDINGREIDVENNNGYIDMSSMEASLYYIKIETDRSNSYKTIVKK